MRAHPLKSRNSASKPKGVCEPATDCAGGDASSHGMGVCRPHSPDSSSTLRKLAGCMRGLDAGASGYCLLPKLSIREHPKPCRVMPAQSQRACFTIWFTDARQRRRAPPPTELLWEALQEAEQGRPLAADAARQLLRQPDIQKLVAQLHYGDEWAVSIEVSRQGCWALAADSPPSCRRQRGHCRAGRGLRCPTGLPVVLQLGGIV